MSEGGEAAAGDGKGKRGKAGDDKLVRRPELLAAVMEKTGLNRAQTGKAMDAVFEVIGERLVAGSEVRVVGFGSFSVSERKAGKGRDPRSGAEIDIPASKGVRFRAGKGLRDLVSGKASGEGDDAA